MDLSGHHSNPSGPLEALLQGPLGGEMAPSARSHADRLLVPRQGARAFEAQHPRQGRIIDAIVQVLTDRREPMQPREVHAEVEALLGEPVRWASVKALLASNIAGRSPRFLRVARGRYVLVSRTSR